MKFKFPTALLWFVIAFIIASRSDTTFSFQKLSPFTSLSKTLWFIGGFMTGILTVYLFRETDRK
ncbi:hypothetical protein [Cellulophaga sp. BC115SP]|uniref:hypothetical protein n=1 Tax=Cellulophaga sp. BC115SP TaxID=2683263 RepID=UPI0014120788|nr:hypothetical protein [Cellulophaga sp. BC115SP]NBB30823.1 hypothetical protein [Cellulophaga sp. BC115SP]